MKRFSHDVFLVGFALVNTICTQKVDANNDARGAAPPEKAQLLFEGQETNKSLKVGNVRESGGNLVLITFFSYVMPQTGFLSNVEKKWKAFQKRAQ